MAPHTPRNKKGGVSKHSRSAVYQKRALYKRKKTGTKAEVKPKETTKTVQVKGDKNGGTRVVPLHHEPRYYPTEDVHHKLASHKKAGVAKLRSSLTPGAVVILLAGPFRGKRAVFLKQLPSGLLLISGPHSLNGVPMRRVNQAYVIGTSAKINISDVKIDDKLNDAYFKRPAEKKKPAGEFFEGKKDEKKKTVEDQRKADQKALDSQLLSAIKKVDLMKEYLQSSFSLKKGDFPHAMKF
eukprot:m.319398 g.319398  ORF g.319398 m.319398 type:complete len:239 (+) comp23145_c0_seq1:83-799(+)